MIAITIQSDREIWLVDVAATLHTGYPELGKGATARIDGSDLFVSATLLDTPSSQSVKVSGPSHNSSEHLSVEFKNVGRTFHTEAGPRKVLRDVNLEITPGEVVSIIGASGCGKSTLLRAIGGLDTENSGHVLIGGTEVEAYDKRTAMGFQEPRLMPWRSIADNIRFGLPHGVSKSQGAERVAHLLSLVGLDHVTHHRPREVSGGMAQRTSLARALARRPGVLLLDEPFGALDALTRLKMQDLLLDVHAKTGTTIVMVTHDVDEALQLSDRIVLLGHDDANTEGATILSVITVPGERPRDRASSELAELRAELLTGLGVSHH